MSRGVIADLVIAASVEAGRVRPNTSRAANYAFLQWFQYPRRQFGRRGQLNGIGYDRRVIAERARERVAVFVWDGPRFHT